MVALPSPSGNRRRISPLIPSEQVYVVVPKEFVHLVQEQIAIPRENIVFEPMGRNTAPCLGLTALVLRAKDPQGMKIALPADHVIRDQKKFLAILEAACQVAAEGDHLVTLGIVPDRPATGYGYIRRGELFAREPMEIYRAEQFVEKPDPATAQRFFAEGCYYWNSGMFVWWVDTFLRALAEYMPGLYAGLREIEAHLAKAEGAESVARVYERLPKISVDYGVMEKAANVLVIPAEIGWSDVGDWSALGALLPQDSEGNAVHARHVGLETEGCVIYAEEPGRVVATLGVKDLVIVETKEALLILPKGRAQEVRRLLEKFGTG